MTDTLAAFRGVTTPLSDLYRLIEEQGWQPGSVKFTNGGYTASATLNGEKIEKIGPDQATAVANVLHAISRKHQIRTPVQAHLGMGKPEFLEKLEEIATEYAKAPAYDPKAAPAWKELADDSLRRVEHLSDQVAIEYTNDPFPYATAQELRDDVQSKQKLLVTTANADHPIWSLEQVLAFRVVHDIMGYTVAGADFGWHGENLAFEAHKHLLSHTAQQALFTETLGQVATATYFGQLPQIKIVLLDVHGEPDVKPALHPSQTVAPTKHVHATKFPGIPCPYCGVAGYLNSGPARLDMHCQACGKSFPVQTDDVETWAEGNPVDLPEQYWHNTEFDYRVAPQDFGPRHFGADWTPPIFVGGNPMCGHNDTFLDEEGLVACAECGGHWEPGLAEAPQEFAHPDPWMDNEPGTTTFPVGWNRRAATALADPNAGWRSGVDPHPQNAYLWHGDPLEAQAVMDNARLVDTGWSAFKREDGTPDRERMKQAIVNAFRVVLLSPRKDLRWNAVHYQDIAQVPASVTDPKVYWDTLETKRRQWNEAQGIDPNAHMVYFKFLKPFEAIIHARNPELGAEGAHEKAEAIMYEWWSQEQQRVEQEDAHKPSHKQRNADEIERRANEGLARRLQQYIKDQYNPKTDESTVHEQPSLFAKVADKGSLKDAIHQSIDYGEAYINDRDKKLQIVLGDADSDELFDRVRELAKKEYPNYEIEVGSEDYGFRVFRRDDYSKLEPNWRKFAGRQDWWDNVDDYAHTQITNPKYWEGMNLMAGLLRNAETNVQLGTPLDQAVNKLRQEMTTYRWPQHAIDETVAQFEESMMDRQPGDTTFPEGWTAAGEQYNMLTGEAAGKYGAFMGTHLKAISQISQHADELVDAALQDVQEHDGAGHHFRSAVLQLGVSGVGPKVCSFAWLLLQPMTSQLGTIDTHMMDVLGHDYEKEMNNRDYFKFERELAAGRDAAGYGHIPLGAFQWGMWDYKRTGPGSHQDHSAMRVLDPIPHNQVDWASKALNLKGDSWHQQAPQWWVDTLPHRQQVAEDWDKNVASGVSRTKVPFQVYDPDLHKIARKDPRQGPIPWYAHPDGSIWTGFPGQSYAHMLRQVHGVPAHEYWNAEERGSMGKYHPETDHMVIAQGVPNAVYVQDYLRDVLRPSEPNPAPTGLPGPPLP